PFTPGAMDTRIDIDRHIVYQHLPRDLGAKSREELVNGIPPEPSKILSGLWKIITVLMFQDDLLKMPLGLFGSIQGSHIKFPQGKMGVVGQDAIGMELHDFQVVEFGAPVVFAPFP